MAYFASALSKMMDIGLYYTVFRKKNKHSRFLPCLPGKCLDLHKIFRKCLRRIKYFIDVFKRIDMTDSIQRQ